MPEPFDSADLDALQELERSHGYSLLTQRFNQVLENKRRDLERRADVPDTAYLRGEIAALRLVLRLPEVLAQEIAQQIKDS